MDFIKTLREEFSTVHADASKTIENAAAEKRDLNDAEKAENEKRFARLDAIKHTIDEHTKFARIALDEAKVEQPKQPGRDEYERSEGITSIKDRDLDRSEFGKALCRWAGNGVIDRKFATITTATASSILLPKTVLAPVTHGPKNAFREAFEAWGVPVFSTPGDTSVFNLPVIDPTAGGQVAENAGSETENAPSFSESIVSTPKTYQSGSVYYSNLQLSATPFDLLASTVPSMVFNKELGLESVIAAAMIADSGITQVVRTATTSGVTWANFVSLNNKLPKRYQNLKVILLSASAYEAAEGLVDDVGRPIMTVDAQNQNLKRIGGSPVIRCDYLEAFGAVNRKVGLIFSLSGMHLRDCGEGIARYDQVPAKPNQVGINLFGYHAYGYSVSSVAVLETPAS